MPLLFDPLAGVEATHEDDVVLDGADVPKELGDARPVAAKAASPEKPTGPLLSMPAVRCGAPRLTMAEQA